MKLFNDIYNKSHFTEQLYGNTATIYFHTRNATEALNLLSQNKWFSKSNVYGRGIYSVYDPNDLSTGYGSETVKAYIGDLSNYFCFEEYDCIKVYTECKKDLTDDFDYIDWQEKKFGCKCPRHLGQLYENYDSEPWKTFIRKVDGIIYYGQHDGHCILTYKPSLLKPMKYYGRKGGWGEVDWYDVDEKQKDICSAERFGLEIESLTYKAQEYLKSKGIAKRQNPNNAVVNMLVETKVFKDIISKEDLEKVLSGEIEENPVNMVTLAYKSYMNHQKDFIIKRQNPIFSKQSPEKQEMRIKKDMKNDNLPLFLKGLIATLEMITPNCKRVYANPEYIKVDGNEFKNVNINYSLIDTIDKTFTDTTINSDFYFPGLVSFDMGSIVGKALEKVPDYVICTNEEYLCIYTGYKNQLKTDKYSDEITDFLDHVEEKFGPQYAEMTESYIEGYLD